ncbi:MAG: prepilin-type N-terminal cleavage/methylation domain-containing protein [Deltaproteobacteria bacterium]|nr:prepilin-type N-terminal cleavage/methylation domain-containing protein [Deltaproteobacteria bacterium]
MHLTRGKNETGFTLIELMVVIAIIGILAAIAIPNFVSYRRRAYNASANTGIKNLYTAAQAYFTDNHSASTTDLDDYKAYGFRQAPDVAVTIQGAGSQGSFSAEVYHSSGDKTYTVASDGDISS